MSEKQFEPRIRSFVRRLGRITPGQQQAIDELWPKFGKELSDGMLDYAVTFGRETPRILEIGFGDGAALEKMALEHTDQDFIGIEVHTPGVGRLLKAMKEHDIHNIRIFHDDAVDVLQGCIPDESLDKVLLFFPDPWQKKRHNKRRLVQVEFVELLYKKLKPFAVFHMATDWEDYAEHMMLVMEQVPGFLNAAGKGLYSPRPQDRPLTKFEKRGEKLGHGVWDLIFIKQG